MFLHFMVPFKYLQAVRASKDVRRKKEGQARISALSTSMKRLDLIWDVEFFADGRATSVVHNMQTIAELLDLDE